MAAKGLPDVIQKFAAENSEYLRALQQNRESVEEFVTAVRAMEERLLASGRTADEVAKRSENLYEAQIDQLKNAVDWQRALNAMTEKNEATNEKFVYNALKGFQAYEAGAKRAQLIQSQINTETQRAADMQVKLQVAQEKAAAAQVAAQEKVAAATAKAQDIQVAAQEKAMATQVKLGEVMAKQAMQQLYITTQAGKYTTENVRQLQQLAGAMEPLARMPIFGQAQPSAYYNPFTGQGGFAQPRIPFPLQPAVAQPPPPDSGGGFGAFLGAAANAFRPSTIFGGATSTLAGAHMAVMLTAEIASQVIPAAVAAGAAAGVGFQGAKYATLRGMGIYTAGEALTGAYDTTNGQLFGMGPGYQTAQNQATGGVYGIIGNIMRMAAQGAGPGGILGPGGMGVQTVAMINRGIANMVGSGRAAQLSQALGGGTGALQTIGDIFGNLGDTVLNLAPNLPGVGGDLFASLKGVTGAASFLTGHIPGQLLGAGLAAEAGYRWGGPILGGGKLPFFLGGRQFQGLAGFASRGGLGTLPMTAEEVVAAGLAPDLAAAGAGEAGTGLAGLLSGGALGLPIGGLAAGGALAAWLVSRAWTPGAQRGLPQQMGTAQNAINASFGAGSLPPIKQALYQVSAAQQQTLAGTGPVVTDPTLRALVHAGAMTPAQAAAKQLQELGGYAQQFTSKLGEMTAAAPATQQALAGLGVKGASLSQAMDYLTMAMISPKDVGPGGKLDATAMSQLAGFVKTYSLMGSGGQTTASAILSASSADYVMSAEPVQKLAQINQALDSMTQMMTGGPASASGLFQLGAAGPATVAQAMATAPGGRLTTAQQNQIAQVLQGNPAAAHRLMRSALSQGPFTATGAAAWQAFTNPQTGIIPASQQNMDQLRTFMTIGGISGAQAGQLGAFELQQSVMPYASQADPMALAMLQQQAMQAGVPGVMMGQSYAATRKAINSHAGTRQQANKIMTQGTQAAANIPGVADFLNPNANINPLQSALYAQMAQTAITTAQHPTQANVSALQSTLGMAGVKPGQMQVGVDAILKNLHVPSNLVAQINGELHVDPAKIPPIHPQVADVTYKVKGKAERVIVPKPPDQSFQIRGHLIYPAIPHPANQTFTITAILRTIGSTGAVGIAGATLPGAGGTRIVGGQHGFRVPGWGGGDVHPAMLEGGEAVVPKHLVPHIAPFLSANKVPGFASGGLMYADVPSFAGVDTGTRAALQSVAGQLLGFIQQAISSVTGGGGGAGGGMFSSLTGGPPPKGSGTTSSPVAVHITSVANAAAAAISGSSQFPGAPGPMPAAANKVIDAFEKTFKDMPGPWSQVASQILNGLLAGVKNSTKETAAMATALVNKVTTEINFGRSVTNTAVAGLNFGGMQVAPPTMTAQGKPYQYYIDQQNIAAGGQPGSVQEQMGSYLQAMQSFQGDMSKLAKGGLEKRLMQQLYAAGPVQGDAEAQSIIGGAGGIKAANKLYDQINSVATKLGVSAIGNVYGQPVTGKTVHAAATVSGAGAVHALQSAINSLHGKSVTVSVNIVAGGSGTSGSSGKLSKTEINQATRVVQQGVLQQAKNNRRGGFSLPGYGT